MTLYEIHGEWSGARAGLYLSFCSFPLPLVILPLLHAYPLTRQPVITVSIFQVWGFICDLEFHWLQSKEVKFQRDSKHTLSFQIEQLMNIFICVKGHVCTVLNMLVSRYTHDFYARRSQ